MITQIIDTQKKRLTEETEFCTRTLQGGFSASNTEHTYEKRQSKKYTFITTESLSLNGTLGICKSRTKIFSVNIYKLKIDIDKTKIIRIMLDNTRSQIVGGNKKAKE